MSSAPRYLGLDLAAHTGYAMAEGNKIVASGVRDLSTKKTEHIGNRYIKFYNFLLTLGRVDEIFYEKIHFMPAGFSSDGGELHKGLLAIMNMYAASYAIPTIGVWPGTLKKGFTGDGHAKKEHMCAQAHSMGWKGGMQGTSLHHDEADAIALLVTELRTRFNITLSF